MNNFQGDNVCVFIADIKQVFSTRLIKFRQKQLWGGTLISVLYV